MVCPTVEGNRVPGNAVCPAIANQYVVFEKHYLKTFVGTAS